MADTHQKIAIQAAIHAFTTKPLYEAATGFFACLGYKSDRTIAVDSVEAFCHQFDPSDLLAHPRAQKASWKSIELLFQLTDEELSRNATLFKDTAVRASLLQSYVFFAVELQPGDYARGKLLEKLPTKLYEKVLKGVPEKHRQYLIPASDIDLSAIPAITSDELTDLSRLRKQLRTLVTSEHWVMIENAKVIDEVLATTERVLNPGSHGGEAPLYKEEVRQALELVKQLERCLS